MMMLTILLGLMTCWQSYAQATVDLVYDYENYNNGTYGALPNRTYISSILESPIWQVNTWKPEMIDHNARHVIMSFAEAGEMSGPKIFSAKDLSLVYSFPTDEDTSNAMIQQYNGEDYLTYWAGTGSAATGDGQGSCYFLNNKY